VYWVPDHTADPATVGHCHRFPPPVYVNAHTGTVVQKFPSTERHHWCGEWSNDEESLLAAARSSVVKAASSPAGDQSA
jgi:hypothetical protein